jgi:FdrA protein
VADGCVVRRNRYYDSVFLMGVSRRLSDVPGVTQAAVLMGTSANVAVLRSIGVTAREIDTAGPGDLVAAVVADSAAVVGSVLADLDRYLDAGVPPASTSNPHTLEDALALGNGANLAVISVPGGYAAREAFKALEAGMSVFLFSDNVSIEDEIRLKKRASELNLLVMGPDCGTALIGGVGVGFANVVRRGSTGAIAASGTGLQELACLVHNAGGGISHALGVGGRDLSDAVGGISTLRALDALESDEATRVVVLISKPPGDRTRRRIDERLEACPKPVVTCFLGAHPSQRSVRQGNVHRVGTMEEAARRALELSGVPVPPSEGDDTWLAAADFESHRSRWSAGQRFLRGLFAGGTFCYQAQQVLRDAGVQVQSNAPLDGSARLEDPERSVGHTLVDMGSDEFTTGRPHPMIDSTVRCQRIVEESRDPSMAVLLLDCILGYNASPDPARELAGAIRKARENVRERGGHLTVVASVCGTDLDPQGFGGQTRLLEQAGAVVFASSRRAAAFCARLLTRQEAGNGA